jgi:hypothetical protein
MYFAFFVRFIGLISSRLLLIGRRNDYTHFEMVGIWVSIFLLELEAMQRKFASHNRQIDFSSGKCPILDFHKGIVSKSGLVFEIMLREASALGAS